MLNSHRRRQFLDLMARENWDQILVYGNGWRKDFVRSLVNVNFSGAYFAASLTRSDELTVVVQDPWDRELAALSVDANVVFEHDFARGLARCFPRAGRTACAIGGIDLMEARFVDAVRQAAGAPPVSATAAVEEARRVKTAEELESLRKAAELADRGYQRFAEVIEAGMKEYELVAEVEAFLKENGAEDNFMLVASGGTEVVGMKPPTDRVLQKGDSVTTELTPQVNGYYAQICRTIVLGEPSAGQLKAFAIFSEAQQAAEDLVKPGVNVSQAARVQNDVFRKNGYGQYTGSQYTRVRGHCLGLYPDETPHILEDVDYVIKEGMVLIAHPNTYLPLSGYMVFGDTLLVTATGSARLNRTPKKLFVKEA
ncbi:MAG: aminopeptidase P family protein [Betaproteobacteria bacterium]|nr:aminopeptidase P family protein [Betaproteobacteria bacterium]